MPTYKNTRKQGDMGLGEAIAYFTRKGYHVSLPLTDNQPYDLIVDRGDGLLKRVQVKTSSYQRKGKYEVSLRVKGGNKTGTGKEKNLDPEDFELLFIATTGGDRYLIPAEEVDAVTTLTLGERQERFRTG